MKIRWCWVMILLLIIRCDEDDPIAKCKLYFLSTYSNQLLDAKYSYGADSLVSEISQTIQKHTEDIAFTYGADKKLSSMFGDFRPTTFFWGSYSIPSQLEFFYNDEGNLSYVLSWGADSISFKYDEQGRILTSSFFTSSYDVKLYLSEYYEFEYIGDRGVKLRQYRAYPKFEDQLLYLGSSEITYDDKPVPFPNELEPMYFHLARKPLVRHNVLTFSWTDDQNRLVEFQDHTYKYNSDGYPVRHLMNGNLIEEFRYTCKP